MFKNYLKVAIRNLVKNKVYSFINIAGLSVGVACCMLIFLYAKDEISYDQFHKNKENIYRVTADFVKPNADISHSGSTGMMPGPSFKNGIPDIQDFSRIQAAFFNVKHKGEIFEQDALWADENLFKVFSFPLIHGDPKTALKDLHSVVLSEELAEKYFGRTDVVGQVIQLKAEKTFEPFVVTAVAKNSPQNSSIQLKMILPLMLRQSIENDNHWINFFLNTFVVLKPGSDIRRIEEQMAKVYNTDAAAQMKMMADEYGFKEKIYYHLQPFTQMHLSTEYPADNGLTGSSNPVYSYILSGIAAFILIIASINFINLSIARSLKRAREIGIRKVVGSNRKQIISQFLGESFTLSFFSFLLASLLTFLILPFFNTLADKELSFNYLMDSTLILGYFALFLITGLMAGFYPALILSRFKPVDTLYGKTRLKSGNFLSKGLVVFQFTLSTFLIIATITIYSQFSYLVNYDLGYNKDNIVSVNTGRIPAEQFNYFKTELLNNAAIKQVSANQGGQWGTVAHINGEEEINFDLKYVDEDYLPLFRIPLKTGRNFSKHFSTDTTQAVMVNESFVKAAGWKTPINEVVDFYYNDKKYQVIGVFKDYHFDALTEKIRPQLFTMGSSYKYGQVFIKILPGTKADALAHLEKTFRKTYPNQPYSYRFEDEENLARYDSEAKWKQIIAFGAILTVFISCIGLFGLTTLAAEKRAKEIGIRKVLGASVRSIAQRLSFDFIKLVCIAAVASLPIAWWAMNKWLQNYPYRIELNTELFIYAFLLVLLIALFTVIFQSLKAAKANPVKNLRTE